MTAFAPTSEQQEALRLFQTGKSLAIEAGAGTGKTSTLVLLAESTPRRGQYIAFNKAIVTDAGAKLPRTVQASTAHALAFRAVGKNYKQRLDNSRRMRSLDIANRLRVDPITLDVNGERRVLSRAYMAGLAMRTVTRFCQSADLALGGEHVPYIDGIDQTVDGVRTSWNNGIVRRQIVPAARRAWEDLSKTTGYLPFKHDHYLKLWHLSGPRIHADYILFDEAQDANPVLLAIVSAQTHAQLVFVGDSQQQIYTFTGAVNALASVASDNRTFLTQSFRFGPGIAAVANDVLGRLHADLRLTGTESIPSVVSEVPEPDAILSRTNATAVRAVMGALKDGTKVHLVGGGGEITAFARAALHLMNGEPTDHPELACFETWGQVQEYVDRDEQGGDLRLMVNLVDEFGADAIIEALDLSSSEATADLVVSTAHKAKGREWDSVRLADDFPGPEKINEDELRLLYVAVTRAKRELDVTAVAVLSASEEADDEEPLTGEAGATHEAPASFLYAAALARAADIVGIYEDDDPETFLRDVLTDLRHYAEANRVDFSAAIQMSGSHYASERREALAGKEA